MIINHSRTHRSIFTVMDFQTTKFCHHQPNDLIFPYFIYNHTSYQIWQCYGRYPAMYKIKIMLNFFHRTFVLILVRSVWCVIMAVHWDMMMGWKWIGVGSIDFDPQSMLLPRNNSKKSLHAVASCSVERESF